MISLSNYNGIVISISGGKDSQTILGVMLDRIKRDNWQGRLLAVHADTGAEWPQSLPHCQMLCKHYGVEFRVALPHRLLPDHIEARCRKLQAAGKKGGWPSNACRYCTSDCKRNPIQKVIRSVFDTKMTYNILSITGERREESTHRAKLPELDQNTMLTAGKRTVLNYRPILDMTLEQVWTHIRETGLPRHRAYDLGNERLSCALCVLANERDLRNGAQYNPELRDRYLQIERETGHTFKNGKSLQKILEG